MNFYGIVDEINYESGIYGRKEAVSEVKKNIEPIFVGLMDTSFISAGAVFSGILPFSSILINIYNFLKALVKKGTHFSPIVKLAKVDNDPNKLIIIPNEALANNYNIKNEDILMNLFTKTEQFEKIMKSHGDSTLLIVERDNLPKNIKHYGGDEGKFSRGIYCEHPKDKNILLPLENYSDLIKTMIIEETLRVFGSLGAKEILIEDISEVESSNKAEVKKVNSEVNVGIKKELMRKKIFGKGSFNTDISLSDTYFISDYPNLMTVVKSRKEGNQILEEFTENININIGLDLDVVGLFKGGAKFNYERKWHFKIEFYDKNES